MRRAIIIAVLLLASPLAAQEDERKESKLFRIMGWTTYATSYGDLATTEYGLAQGAVELNPLQRNCLTRATTHLVVPIVVNYTTAKLYRDGHEKTALWIRIAATAGYGYVIAHNLRQF
jgi:hypothetical protein